MSTKTKRQVNGAIRMAVVVLVILFQLLLIYVMIRYLREHSLYIYVAIEFAAMIQIFAMVSKNQDPDFTISWVLLIAFLPIFGFVLYALWGRSDVRGRRPTRLRAAIARARMHLPENDDARQKLQSQYPEKKRLSDYLVQQGFPVYENTACAYFPLGELQFEQLLQDIRSAQEHIFISTFILDKGMLWDRLFAALAERANAGIDVRILIDDLGSIFTAPGDLAADLKRNNIQLVRFGLVHRFISRLTLNFRSHQKIITIDRHIGYTGGTNIADEYANLIDKHGHWKDTAIRLDGDAVYSLTVTFLEMWEAETGIEQDYEQYKPTTNARSDGFFQPFADGPANNPDNPAETMYRQMIATANEYLYITTPYFIVSGDILEQLATTAQSGIDVRIVTPKKSDHWYVGIVTRSNYERILKAGGRIYEYTPGFIHAKTMLSDDHYAITGSINMDYRSFHMQYENAVFMVGSSVNQAIKEDLLHTFAVSEEIRLENLKRHSIFYRALESFLRLFATLM